jgi:oxygen-independent coproporphyrinogen-3 oxidase
VAQPPGLYLHLPFCSAICPYCDFAVLTGDGARRRRFVDSLCREIALWKADAAAFGGLDTIYFGGGTPSAQAPEEIAAILAAVRAHLGVVPEPWIHFEANPEDVTAESVRAWRALGVDFLSLGVQSFGAAELAFLGRRHTPDEARRSVELARGAGFPAVSLDLIYGLPGQSAEAWRATLETAVALAPDHLSCYQLTFHEGTPFGSRLARGVMSELPEEAQAELFLLTHRLLADAGYPAYEISNFARSLEHRSRHNPKYWDHTPYLGLGPSAHSFDGRSRWWNERKLGPWEAEVERGERPVAGREELTLAQLALEALMLGLRTAEGIDLRGYQERYGLDLRRRNEPLVERLVAERLLEVEGAALRPTLAGWAVADAVARAFDVGP